MPDDRPRLTTWAEIAAFLRCDPRTAQRWAKDRGLPVHSVPGGKKRSVFAYKDELQAWVDGPANVLEVVDTPPAVTPSATVSRRGFLGSALAISLVAGGYWILRPRPQPERAILTGSLLTALDGIGNALWTYRFPAMRQLKESEMQWRVQVLDLSGEGRNGVLVVCGYPRNGSNDAFGPDELFYLDSYGKLRWRVPVRLPLNDHDGRPFETGYRACHVLATPADGRQNLWVAIANLLRWPGAVLRVTHKGVVSVQFANAGNIYSVCRLPSPAGDVMVGVGVNNAFDQACLAAFGANDPPAMSPPGGPGRYRFANGPEGHVRKYFLFPTSEMITALNLPYGPADIVTQSGDGVLARVRNAGGQRDHFYFSGELEPQTVMPDGGIPAVHDDLFRRGSLSHPYSSCPEHRQPLTLRRWDPLAGWRDQPVIWRLPNNLA